MKLDFGEFDKAYNEDLKRRKDEDQRSKKPGHRDPGSNLGLIFIFLLAFFIFANIIDGYVELNQVKFENLELSQRIEDLNVEIEQLQMKLDQKTSRNIIEAQAREKLGMIYPSESQKISIELRRSFALNPESISDIVREKRD